jgi:hypothetical protein
LTVATKPAETETSSDLTRRTARVAEGGAWTESCLPDSTLPQSPVVPAMTISEAVWAHVGATGLHAIAKASLSPEDRCRQRCQEFERQHGEAERQAEAPEGGAELSTEARVEALDGNERKLLLGRLARAYPDVVEAGFALVAEWHADCAEHRRKGLRRREHDRRRRRGEG